MLFLGEPGGIPGHVAQDDASVPLKSVLGPDGVLDVVGRVAPHGEDASPGEGDSVDGRRGPDGLEGELAAKTYCRVTQEGGVDDRPGK